MCRYAPTLVPLDEYAHGRHQTLELENKRLELDNERLKGALASSPSRGSPGARGLRLDGLAEGNDLSHVYESRLAAQEAELHAELHKRCEEEVICLKESITM